MKSSFNLESYLNYIKDKQLRKALTSFRISAHGLEIEKYRYKKNYVPRNERVCSLCAKKNKIYCGDEFHALMICDEFKNQRSKVFTLFECMCPNFKHLEPWEKFVYMLNSEGKLILQTSKLIHKILSNLLTCK